MGFGLFVLGFAGRQRIGLGFDEEVQRKALYQCKQRPWSGMKKGAEVGMFPPYTNGPESGV